MVGIESTTTAKTKTKTTKLPSRKQEAEETLPYWLINVPKDQQPAKCPEFLLDISERNEAMINVSQADYHVLTWPEVQELIETNQIDKFGRAPLDHRRYLEYMFGLKKEHGSVMDFVRYERLKWTDMKPRAKAFEDPADLKILYNDWPYGIDPKIVHLCVWTKFDLEDDPKTGELMPQMRRQIDEYVDRTFKSRVPVENVSEIQFILVLLNLLYTYGVDIDIPILKVIWFKNWSSLKSIHSMEHFHVMLHDPDPEFIREVTNGDSAVSSQLPN